MYGVVSATAIICATLVWSALLHNVDKTSKLFMGVFRLSIKNLLASTAFFIIFYLVSVKNSYSVSNYLRIAAYAVGCGIFFFWFLFVDEVFEGKKRVFKTIPAAISIVTIE